MINHFWDSEKGVCFCQVRDQEGYDECVKKGQGMQKTEEMKETTKAEDTTMKEEKTEEKAEPMMTKSNGQMKEEAPKSSDAY